VRTGINIAAIEYGNEHPYCWFVMSLAHLLARLHRIWLV